MTSVRVPARPARRPEAFGSVSGTGRLARTAASAVTIADDAPPARRCLPEGEWFCAVFRVGLIRFR